MIIYHNTTPVQENRLFKSRLFKSGLFKFIDKIPLIPLAVLAIFMSIAPLSGEPHLIEKLGMLVEGKLSRPIDIFDLFLHSSFIILLTIRLLRLKRVAKY